MTSPLGWWFDVLCVSVFRTDRPCSGIWTKASICTRWTAVMSSTRSPSVPTDTGCVPPPDRASRSGYRQRSDLWLDLLIYLGWIVSVWSCSNLLWCFTLFIYHNSVSIICVVCEVCHAGSLASILIFHICFIHGNTQHYKSSRKLIELRSSNAIDGHFKCSMYCNVSQCKMNTVGIR